MVLFDKPYTDVKSLISRIRGSGSCQWFISSIRYLDIAMLRNNER